MNIESKTGSFLSYFVVILRLSLVQSDDAVVVNWSEVGSYRDKSHVDRASSNPASRPSKPTVENSSCLLPLCLRKNLVNDRAPHPPSTLRQTHSHHRNHGLPSDGSVLRQEEKRDCAY